MTVHTVGRDPAELQVPFELVWITVDISQPKLSNSSLLHLCLFCEASTKQSPACFGQQIPLILPDAVIFPMQNVQLAVSGCFDSRIIGLFI